VDQKGKGQSWKKKTFYGGVLLWDWILEQVDEPTGGSLAVFVLFLPLQYLLCKFVHPAYYRFEANEAAQVVPFQRYSLPVVVCDRC
jgi:hypothetical protein